jgi:hypothetical protein
MLQSWKVLGQLFYHLTVRQVLGEFPEIRRLRSVTGTLSNNLFDYLRDCTFNECLASRAESRTFDEWAPSLRDSLIEYSLSDLPRP